MVLATITTIILRPTESFTKSPELKLFSAVRDARNIHTHQSTYLIFFVIPINSLPGYL